MTRNCGTREKTPLRIYFQQKQIYRPFNKNTERAREIGKNKNRAIELEGGVQKEE